MNPYATAAGLVIAIVGAFWPSKGNDNDLNSENRGSGDGGDPDRKPRSRSAKPGGRKGRLTKPTNEETTDELDSDNESIPEVRPDQSGDDLGGEQDPAAPADQTERVSDETETEREE